MREREELFVIRLDDGRKLCGAVGTECFCASPGLFPFPPGNGDITVNVVADGKLCARGQTSISVVSPFRYVLSNDGCQPATKTRVLPRNSLVPQCVPSLLLLLFIINFLSFLSPILSGRLPGNLQHPLSSSHFIVRVSLSLCSAYWLLPHAQRIIRIEGNDRAGLSL